MAQGWPPQKHNQRRSKLVQKRFTYLTSPSGLRASTRSPATPARASAPPLEVAYTTPRIDARTVRLVPPPDGTAAATGTRLASGVPGSSRRSQRAAEMGDAAQRQAPVRCSPCNERLEIIKAGK